MSTRTGYASSSAILSSLVMLVGIVASPVFPAALQTGSWAGLVFLGGFAAAMLALVRSLRSVGVAAAQERTANDQATPPPEHRT